MGDSSLILRIELRPARSCEMMGVHAAGKRVDMWVRGFFVMVETMTPGENEIDFRKKLFFPNQEIF